MMNNISILIPAFNEADKIQDTIEAVKKSPYITRIIVLDDGSTDHTYDVVCGLGVEAYRFNKNQGKGHALNFGISKAVGDSKIVVFLDADIGSSAHEVDKLIVPLLEENVDVTIAKFPSPKKKGGIGLVKKLAHQGVRHLTGKEVKTALSGQRAFKVEVLQNIGNVPKDYGIEVGMIIDILNAGYIVKEIEVEMSHRETGRDLRGFIHRGKQFYQILRTLIQKSNEVRR